MTRQAPDRARLRRNPIRMTPELKDLIRRRTRPFLDSIGIDRPVSFLLEEAYLQGMQDAVDAMGHRVSETCAQPDTQ